MAGAAGIEDDVETGSLLAADGGLSLGAFFEEGLRRPADGDIG